MTVPRVVYCQDAKCIHFMGAKGVPNFPVFVCAAFPKGIPEEVLSGRNMHTSSIAGDGGVQYAIQTVDGEKIDD